jgi:hypothetical protein
MISLTNHSPFASISAGIFWYLLWFAFGLYCFRNKPKNQTTLLFCALLVTLAPQIMRQNRFIWNPSFTPPLILAMFFSFQALITKYQNKTAWLFFLSGAAAIGFTFASSPIVLILLIVLLIKAKIPWLKSTFMFVISLSIVFLPMLVFELRHQFTLTYLLINGQHLPQLATSFYEKIAALNTFLPSLTSLLGVITVSLKFKPARWYAAITLIILTFYLFGPVNLESHYIFPLICLEIFLVAQLPIKISMVLSLCLSLVWFSSPIYTQVFTPATRTVNDLNNCYRDFCKTAPKPLYVSMQSAILPYHNAPEHRYFMRQNGCQVLDIESTQDQSQYMAVINDGSAYEHGKTAYNELTLFGSSMDTGTFVCQDNLSIHVLKKLSVNREQ